jgi:hypothetical protein
MRYGKYNIINLSIIKINIPIITIAYNDMALTASVLDHMNIYHYIIDSSIITITIDTIATILLHIMTYHYSIINYTINYTAMLYYNIASCDCQ